jgi:hypothetical protein
MIMEIPLTDGELETLERQARDLWSAMQHGDLDTAYIIGSTSENPGLLSMYVAGVANEDLCDVSDELHAALEKLEVSA